MSALARLQMVHRSTPVNVKTSAGTHVNSEDATKSPQRRLKYGIRASADQSCCFPTHREPVAEPAPSDLAFT